MRFAVPSQLDATTDAVKPVLAALTEKPKDQVWSFADLESQLTEYPAMAVRKAVWHLSSLGKVRFTPAMKFVLR